MADAFDPNKASDNRVVLLAGSDSEGRRSGLAQLLQALEATEDGFDSESIVADARPPSEWVAAACAVPFLAEYRVVVVRNIARVDPDDFASNLKALLSEVPASGRLVLVADDETGDGDRQTRLGRNTTRWAKAVKDVKGLVVTFEPLAGDKATAALRQRAKDAGKNLTPDLATLMMEMLGGRYNAAAAELDKLILYIGDATHISERDIEVCVVPDQDYNVYKLMDAVVAGHPGAALVQLRTLTGKADKIEGETFSRVFPTLSRQFRLLWQARLFVERNVHPDNPPVDILALLPKKPNLADEADWKRRKIVQSAKRTSYDQLARAMELVVDCDARLKGQRASVSTADTLEQTVLRLAQTFR
ncbi:MAG: DNA polymerase III subunit delta [Armatimonadetes bacterium]|nr:DNA polymerase III subunit delta [Armatimonadota bacterium]